MNPFLASKQQQQKHQLARHTSKPQAHAHTKIEPHRKFSKHTTTHLRICHIHLHTYTPNPKWAGPSCKRGGAFSFVVSVRLSRFMDR